MESRTAVPLRFSDKRIGCACRALIKVPVSLARRGPKCAPVWFCRRIFTEIWTRPGYWKIAARAMRC